MAITIVVRWAGVGAASGSTYKVERTLDWDTWTELAAAQAATSPYVSPVSALAGDVAHGAASVALDDASSFSSSGYAWLDDALIQWTGKSTNTLTGVTWHSGYGTYLADTAVYEAHESYSDSTTPTLGAVVYRITHTDSSGRVSEPRLMWYYYPDVPESADHAVLICNIGADVGAAPQADVAVSCYLATDQEFALLGGAHLDQNAIADNLTSTNALGLAFFHVWRSVKRAILGGSSGAYTVVLGEGQKALTLSIPTVPDQSWVLLSDVAELPSS